MACLSINTACRYPIICKRVIWPFIYAAEGGVVHGCNPYLGCLKGWTVTREDIKNKVGQVIGNQEFRSRALK